MKLGVVLNSGEPETAWNAFRLAVAALKKNHEVRVFLLGKGVECENIQDDAFGVREEIDAFRENKGKILACGTCLYSRRQKVGVCSVSSMDDLLRLVEESDKMVFLG